MLWFTVFITHFVSYWVAYLPFGKINRHVASICLLNQFGITLPLCYLMNDSFEKAVVSSAEDSLFLTLYKIILVTYMSNLFFYWVHWMMHSRFLFHYVHHVHHRFEVPVVSMALYAHPIDHLFSNTLCFILPLVWIGLSYYWMLGLVSFCTVSVVLAYLGKSHQLHHRYFYYNYGFGYYLDWCNGTHLSLDEVQQDLRGMQKRAI